MDLHERYVHFPTAYLEVLDFLDTSFKNKPLAVLHPLVCHYNEEIAANRADSKKPETLRSLLCYEYQLIFDPRMESESESERWERTCLQRVGHVLLAGRLPHLSKHVTVLYDIAILQMVLYCNLECIEQHLNKFRQSAKQDYLDDNETRNFYMRTVEAFLDAFRLRKYLYKTEGSYVSDKIIQMYQEDISSWLEAKKEKEWGLFASFFPKLINTFPPNNILQHVYYVVLHKLEDLKDSLTALSLMTNECLSLDQEDTSHTYCTVYYSEELWLLIIEGLKSPVQQYQKQALFVMKRIIDIIHKINRNDITETKSMLVPFLCNQPNETGSLVNNIKEQFFLIWEALHEKQYHLVAPALTHLPYLIKSYEELTLKENTCNIIWLQLLFERILHHGNKKIVKQGILYICNFDPSILDDKFLNLFVNILNNTFLYECESYKEEPTILSNLRTLFIHATEKDTEFSARLLNVINEVAWGPVALFYMMRILQTVSSKTAKCISSAKELLIVKVLIQKHLSMHSQTFRIASQVALIQTIVNSLKQIDDFLSVINVLFEFPPEEALTPGSYSWGVVVQWLKQVLAKEDAVHFVDQACERLMHEDMNHEVCPKKFALAVSILYDAKKILHQSCPTEKILNNLLSSLDGIDVRPYADIRLSIDIMEFMSHLLNTKENAQNISKLFLPYIDISMQFLLKNLRNIPSKLNYEGVQKYLHIVTIFLSNETFLMSRRQTFDYAEKFHSESMFLLNNIKQYQIMHCLCALHILHLTQHILKTAYCTEILLNMPKLQELIDKKQDPASKARVTSDCYLLLGKLLYQYISREEFKVHSEKIEWFQSISDIYEMGGKEVIPVVAFILKAIVDKKGIANESDRFNFESIFAMCWRSILLNKRNKLFWLAVRNLTSVIINDKFLVLPNAYDFASQYVEQLLEEGDSMPKLKRCLLYAIEQLDLEYFKNFQVAVLSCLLHGYAPRKDKKIESELYLYIAEHCKHYYPEHISIVNHNNDAVIRAHAALLLHKVISTNSEYTPSFLSLVVDKLKKFGKERCYNNSYVHKVKHRIMQTLLILQPTLNEEDSILLAKHICDRIIMESDQHSVRLMQEWILVRIFIKNTSLHHILWELFEEAIKTRPTCTGSLASIVWYTARCLSDAIQRDFICSGLKYITQCCLGQQPHMRLYNQVTFVKLHKLLQDENFVRISKYEGLYEAVEERLLHGNFKKHSSQIQDDPYVSVFHPINYYSLQTIYYELPRIAETDGSEWIPPNLFDDLNFKVNNHPLQLYNSNNSLSEIKGLFCQAKHSTDDTEILSGTINTSTDGLSNIQKKIDPLALANVGNNDASVSIRQSIMRKKFDEESMIVVASLIDRLPNLGGLARTCEIFGVKELVIGNLNHTKNKDFQNLSVSADKWINISEVKPYKLCEYMLEKKETGWTLVGAEQTANSVELQSVKFNKKTVLLLGNEKDGIPANLIPLLDTCVEIPQTGIIRSLNVHVTGAICIWQYSKQHILPRHRDTLNTIK